MDGTALDKRCGTRMQKSVFEAQLKPSQVRGLLEAIEGLMASERYFNPRDNVRVYKIAGNCDVTVFGECTSEMTVSDDIFI